MIAYAFLFLGLIVGPHQVELIVEGDRIAKVVLELDGQPRAEKSAPPWTFDLDFGDRLAPHQLLAVGVDADGQEVARAHQWINLPRSAAEASIVFEGADRRRPTAGRLVWQHIEYHEAEAVTVAVDGEPLTVDADWQFALPELDYNALHVVTADIAFPDHTRYRAEVTFGGAGGAVIDTELTGVPLSLRGSRPPRLNELQGQITVGGKPTRVMALERSPAKVVIVFDLETAAALREMATYNLSTPLRPGEQLEFFFPVPTRTAGTGARAARLFAKSQPFTARDGGLAWLMTRVQMPEPLGHQPLSDALAAAAVAAAEGGRPRAAVLVVGDDPIDVSAFRVEEVLAYYQDLRVPLLLWRITRGGASRVSEDRRPLYADTPWGQARDIGSANRMVAAIDDLRQVLDAQHTVWIEGSHLPNQVAIAATARRIQLAGVD